jgi:outer membrane lipoprotein-sorting protein
MKKAKVLAVAGFFGLTGLTGCFSSVRTVAKVQTVGTYRTASVSELEAMISERDAAIRTLNASVLVTYSTGGGREGQVKTYTSFRGYIFVRKPRDLRVILQLPIVGGEAMDMVSDSGSFTLLVPPRKQAFVGTGEVTKPSANAVENMRPAVFFDSLLVPGVSAEEYVDLTQSTREIEPARGHKPAVEEPDYDLSVYRVSSDHVLQIERVIHISRVTMLPYRQDIYDKDGRLVTQATYANYAPVGAEEQLPRLVTIVRPIEEYSLKIQVTKLTLNEAFENDQFELKVPASYKLTRLQ